MKKVNFFVHALKTMKTTGAISSSSEFLAEKMMNPIHFDAVKNIIELGTGHGTLTKEILKRMSSGCRLTSFEINDVFYRESKELVKDARLNIMNEDARNIHQFFDPESVDVVISGLPLAMMPDEIKTEILHQVKKALRNDGYFIQFQYSPLDFRLVRSFFPSFKLKFTILNLPPALIYVCRK